MGRLSIGQKIMAVVGLSVLSVIAVGAVSAVSMAKIGQEIEQIAETDLPIVNRLGNITVHQLDQAILFERGMRLAQAGDVKNLEEVVTEFNALALKVDAEIADAELLVSESLSNGASGAQKAELEQVLTALQNIATEHKSYNKHVEEAFQALSDGNNGLFGLDTGLIEGIEAEQAKLDHELEALLTEIQGFTLAAAQTAEHDEKAALKLITGIAALAAFLTFSLSWLMARRTVTKPLEKIVDALDALADGNTDLTVEVNSRDEVGRLGEAFNVFREKTIENKNLAEEKIKAEARLEQEKRQSMIKMADDLESSIGSVISSVTASADQMKSSATSMTSIADEASHRSSSVAAASEQATANVQTVATATEELSASVEEISRQVAQSAQMALTAVDNANATNAKVEGLADAAQKIGEVVNLINDIAAQTNLLALNATIEASRAGEAGKGFAVVASEVKSLATQTAKATEEIGAQIAAIQGETREAVEAIQEIGKSITDISDTATAIASAVEEQGAATREIAENVQQAAAGTQDVSSNIVEVSRGAEETGSSAQEVLGAAEQLGTQSDELQAAVSSFLDRVKAA
tara:strand:+ start:45494 stop:47233 length:1740 start_codon:yes stop_codon:yes gene_type:complete